MSAGTVLTFFAYFFLGIGPGVTFFGVILAPKSFLVLLSIFSAFLWLVVMLGTSGIFRGFYPISDSQQSYAGVLVASVFIQEVVRYGVWRLHKKATVLLEKMAEDQHKSFNLIDKMYLGLAWGFGHAACHSVFFFLSMLPLTTGDGTYYNELCPQMSMFLVGALYSNGMGMVLTAIMVVALEGYHERSYFHIAYAPIMHLGASLLTLLNLRQGGCRIAMPLLVALGGVNVLYAMQLAWRKGTQVVKEIREHPDALVGHDPVTYINPRAVQNAPSGRQQSEAVTNVS